MHENWEQYRAAQLRHSLALSGYENERKRRGAVIRCVESWRRPIESPVRPVDRPAIQDRAYRQILAEVTA